jgi:Arc/MetJ-type ribon-helix-helix transcriptional regulator
MSSKRSITVRLDAEDVAALERARADGLSSSDLIRRGLRLVAARYYRGKRRPPSTALFAATRSDFGLDPC